jgi:hypothetical protein
VNTLKRGEPGKTTSASVLVVGTVAFVAAVLAADAGHLVIFGCGVAVTLGATAWLARDAWRTRARVGR